MVSKTSRLSGTGLAIAATHERIAKLEDRMNREVTRLKAVVPENKAWLQGNIERNSNSISSLNAELCKLTSRVYTLEVEVKRLKSSRFSFKTYLSRLFNALRNKP